MGAPLNAYRLAQTGDVRVPDAAGSLLEIPLSSGYNRSPFALWSSVHRLLRTPALRPLRLAGAATRSGALKRIFLNPEFTSTKDMLQLSRRLVEQRVRHLQLSFHSPSLRPGTSEFAATAADVARIYDSLGRYVDGLSRFARLTVATIDEAATMLEDACKVAVA